MRGMHASAVPPAQQCLQVDNFEQACLSIRRNRNTWKHAHIQLKIGCAPRSDDHLDVGCMTHKQADRRFVRVPLWNS